MRFLKSLDSARARADKAQRDAEDASKELKEQLEKNRRAREALARRLSKCQESIA